MWQVQSFCETNRVPVAEVESEKYTMVVFDMKQQSLGYVFDSQLASLEVRRIDNIIICGS